MIFLFSCLVKAEQHCSDTKSKHVCLTRHPRHYTSDIVCDSEEVGHCGGVQKLVLFKTERKDSGVTTASTFHLTTHQHRHTIFITCCKSKVLSVLLHWQTNKQTLTGTFFCVTTTAQSFPLTATDVSPPWFMALNAYSVRDKENVLKLTHQPCREKAGTAAKTELAQREKSSQFGLVSSDLRTKLGLFASVVT